MVVPFPPGGQVELSALPVAAEFSKALGIPIEIDYKPGKSGVVGNTDVARAQPDGARILMAIGSVATMPDAYRIRSEEPPYKLDQLLPVTRVLLDPYMLNVGGGAPWTSIEEFVAEARRRPGEIVFGSTGAFGSQHMAMSMLIAAERLELQHKTYQGAGPLLNGLLAGEVACCPAIPGLIGEHVAAGRLKVLACWGKARHARYPEVPTLIELGHEGAHFTSWTALFAPAGLPESLRFRLQQIARSAMKNPSLLSIFERAGCTVAHLDGPALAAFIESERQRLVPVLEFIRTEEERAKATSAAAP